MDVFQISICLLVKIIDRLHNIQTIGHKSPEKAKKIIIETLVNFTPVVMCAGLLEIKKTLAIFTLLWLYKKSNLRDCQFFLLMMIPPCFYL